MARTAAILPAMLASLLMLPTGLQALPAEASRQFVVEAPSSLLRDEAFEQAEQTRKRVYAAMGLPDVYVEPIRILFRDSELGDDVDDFRYEVNATPAIQKWEYAITGWKSPPEGSRTMGWSEAVITALQLEIANRVSRKKTGVLASWPKWFLLGMTGLAGPEGREHTEELWNRKYHRKTYRDLRAIWSSTAPEDEEKERISVLSSLLVSQLVQLPDGRSKFIRLCQQINSGTFDEKSFLKIYQGDFPTHEAAEKWWLIRQAEFSRGSELYSLDLADTVARLEEILDGGIPEPGINGLDEDGVGEVNEIQKRLYQLLVVGHPMAKSSVHAAVNALESVRTNDMRKARPSWENARTIMEALRPWKNRIDSVLDEWEYRHGDPSVHGWLKKKGFAD